MEGSSFQVKYLIVQLLHLWISPPVPNQIYFPYFYIPPLLLYGALEHTEYYSLNGQREIECDLLLWSIPSNNYLR